MYTTATEPTTSSAPPTPCYSPASTSPGSSPGGDYFRKRDPERITKRLVAQLESLGHHVILEELPQAA
jgi:hypothetical protein